MAKDKTRQAHDYLIAIGSLVMRFASVARAPRYPNGNRETDVEHSFHLSLSAIELAADFYPELDIGLVSQFGLVHDLPEVYAGDVWTFMITDEDKHKKDAEEAKAIERLMKELPPHLAQLLNRYEKQEEPEARFVRLVDKLTPVIINMSSGADTFRGDYKIESIEQLTEAGDEHIAKFQAVYPEFDVIHLIHKLLADSFTEHVFKH